METLKFEFKGGKKAGTTKAATVVGVVGSGNLEVLIEHKDLGGACHVEVITAAVGFAPIWQAVLDDFFARHPLSNIQISINDVGATPAVVSLRLDQAVESILGAP